MHEITQIKHRWHTLIGLVTLQSTEGQVSMMMTSNVPKLEHVCMDALET